MAAPVHESAIEHLLKSREFWMWVLIVMVVVSVVKALWHFNKFILAIVILVSGALGMLYAQPGWLQRLWGAFN